MNNVLPPHSSYQPLLTACNRQGTFFNSLCLHVIKTPDKIFILLFLLIGIAIRLVWVGDMEWKDDEKIMYDLARETAHTGGFPAIGMMSGGGVVNPGLSVALFSWISLVTDGPAGMAKAVQIINVLAILLLLYFMQHNLPSGERKTWYFALALAAVSPLAVLFSRKIWAQDMLPLFTVLLLFAISTRSKRAGAFFYGLLALLIGQIHMSGFFLAAGFMAFSFLYDLYHKRKIQWLWWIIGGIAGLIPLIPWLHYISNHQQGSYLIIDHVLQLRFYIYIFLDAHGLNLVYTFEKEITEFYRYPVIGGRALFMVGCIYCILIVFAVFTLWLIIKYVLKVAGDIKSSVILKWIFSCSQTRFYLQGIFIGLGLLMTLSGTEIYPHYLICIFPFSYVWVSRIYADNLKYFKIMIITQAALTIFFLFYVYQNDGIINGDYGKTYESQISGK